MSHHKTKSKLGLALPYSIWGTPDKEPYCSRSHFVIFLSVASQFFFTHLPLPFQPASWVWVSCVVLKSDLVYLTLKIGFLWWGFDSLVTFRQTTITRVASSCKITTRDPGRSKRVWSLRSVPEFLGMMHVKIRFWGIYMSNSYSFYTGVASLYVEGKETRK